jgi:hypothetical protein
LVTDQKVTELLKYYEIKMPLLDSKKDKKSVATKRLDGCKHLCQMVIRV